MCVLFPVSQFCSIDEYVSEDNHTALIIVTFQQASKSESMSLPNLFFFFKTALAIPGPLNFHMIFKTILSISTQKPTEILIETELNL